MRDRELVLDILRKILWSVDTISKRFALIESVSDFVSSDEGVERLHSICMQLIAIGDSVKQLDRLTDGKLLLRYPDVEWKRIAGMRDILSHHYFDIDAEIVYEVCSVHLSPLRANIERMLAEE